MEESIGANQIKRMKKILIIYSARIPSVELVLKNIYEFSKNEAVDITEKQVIDVRKKHIENADVILAIRPFEISSYGIIKASKQAGKEIIVYLDDDLLHLPHVYSSKLRKLFTVAMYKHNCRYLKEILSKCDVLWGSSDYLLKQYEKYVVSGKCVKTDICTTTLGEIQTRPDQTGINIVYAGSGNHYVHLNKYIIPALNRLSSKYNVSLTCVGMRKENIIPTNFQLSVHPWMNSLDEYNLFMKKNHFDLGVAPTEQTDFYRCKYFNKYIEYTSLGIIGIYTDDFPYRSVIIDGANGLLASNNDTAWEEKLEYAITHQDECMKMAENAQKDVASKFDLDAQLLQIKTQITELYCDNYRSYGKVRFKPNYMINYARRWANRFVGFYEGIRNK